MGGKSTPAPDYRAAAEEQGQSGKENIITQTWANRPQLNTPWGQQTWSTGSGTDPSTGMPVTQWTSNINLTPEQQSALDSQQRIQQGRSNAAETLLGQATGSFQSPFNWAGLPGMAATPGVRETTAYGLDTSAPQQTTATANEPGFAGERQRIENALFERMRPEHQRAEEASRTRLANMGMTMGSQGYNRELERLGGLQAGERFNALQTAGGEQARLNQMLLAQQGQAFGQDVQSQQAQNAALAAQFGMGLQANQQNFGQGLQAANFQNQLRQQAIAEEAQRRGMSLNELNALLTQQQVGMPQMPTFTPAGAAAATPYLNAAQMQGQANQQDSGGSGIGTLLGGVAGSFFGPVGTAIGSQLGGAITKG
jgi:hypothetical protein